LDAGIFGFSKIPTPILDVMSRATDAGLQQVAHLAELSYDRIFGAFQ
jgi:hypothetical protein